MKYYYGNTPEEAVTNPPVEIKSTSTLESYHQNYTIVVPACDIEEDCEEKEGLTVYLVSFDTNNQNLMQSFDTKQEALQYAKDNVLNLPAVTRCWQSDIDEELGYGEDYEEEDITMDDEELAYMLDKYIN